MKPKPSDGPHKQQDALKLTEQYIGLLILVFNSAGLMDVRMLETKLLVHSDASYVRL